MPTWRDQANAVIEAAARTWLGGKGKSLTHLHTLTRDEKRDLLKAINAAYPWGERANHPYKIWLSALADFRSHLGEELPPCPAEGLFAAIDS